MGANVNLLRVLPFSAASLLMLSIGCGSSPSTATTTVPVPTLYVVQNNATTNVSSVLEFPATGQGSITPIAALNAPTGFIFSTAAVDDSGNIYVAAYNLDTPQVSEILEYASGATGAASPIRTLTLPPVMTPGAIAVDATGQVYVLLYGGNEINIYAAGATGNAAPTRQINGPMALLNDALSLAVDSAQNIYVANNYGSNVLVFASTANGSVLPTRVIVGNATGLFLWPSGITVDAVGDIFTTSDSLATQVLLEFAPGANGNVAPIRSLDSPSAQLFLGVAVDATGNLYTVNENPSTLVPSILVYSPNASGITAPTATITSTAWTASHYGQIAIH